MKIINTAPMPGAFLQEGLLARVPGIAYSIVDAHRLPEERLVAEVADADLLVGDYTGGTPITRSIVKAAGRLQLIQQPSVGYNHIDIEACREFGIPVANTPGANDIGVAEHTVMLVLACLKKLTLVDAATHRGEWLFDQRREIGVFELNGKTYGLLGMGRTARAVAARLVPFGVRLLYNDIVRLGSEEEEKYQATYASIEEILKKADVVSLHLPLTRETEGIINAAMLALMKPTAVLINVGRGPLVDETALAEALTNKRLAMAAVDVFSQEPPPKNHPLFGLPNVILTPHLAGSTLESAMRIIDMTLGNLSRVIRGEKPLWLLNP
jgi:phosphoglycerate dehydrogenase-like enzyme